MKVISLHQPWASLLVTRQPCDCPDGVIQPRHDPHTTHQMVKRFETRSWPFPPALIGQPIIFHATKTPPRGGEIRLTGDYYWYVGKDGAWMTDGSFADEGRSVRLPLGAIVGSGRITASYPIVGPDSPQAFDPMIWTSNAAELRLCSDHDGRPDGRFANELDISDQLPYGDFTPGRYAWLIEDAAPCTERCPCCCGRATWACDNPECYEEDDVTCPVCDGAGRCEPIPARGHQRIWNWEAA